MIKVLQSRHVPLTNRVTGKPILCMKMQQPTSLALALMPLSFSGEALPPGPPPPTETVILVHPDRWDAFYMAINQPDVFCHPEVRALLLGQPEPQAALEELRAATERA